jgi:AraC family transcriptional regulator of arabinose operon
MNALERLLLVCASQRPSEGRAIDGRIRHVVGHIHADLRLSHTLESLSAQAGLSPSRFAHLFKAEMGLSPRQYLLQQRILHARSLLERTSLSVTEVAHAVGMDPVAFSLRFKEELGHSPRAHRKG